MRDKAAKAAYDRARYVARQAAKPDMVCARPGCEKVLPRNRRGGLLYCNSSCRAKAFYHAHYVPKPRVYKPRPELPPIPRSYTGDAIFEEARKVLRFDSPGDFEDDILGEAVLAIVEGRDPQAAVRRFLAAEKAAKVRRVRGIDDVGYADGRLVIVWKQREGVAA